jgi:hypothetical protein
MNPSFSLENSAQMSSLNNTDPSSNSVLGVNDLAMAASLVSGLVTD